MRILHVLDHSIPLHSGYTFRTRSILREQRALGWETFHVTGSKQGASDARRRRRSTACTSTARRAASGAAGAPAGAEPDGSHRRPGSAA